MGLIGILTLTVLVPLTFNKPVTTFNLIPSGAIALVVILLAVRMRREDRSIKPTSYDPMLSLYRMSNDEYHKFSASQMYPRRSWIVAIVSAAIGMVAVGVLIWGKVSP